MPKSDVALTPIMEEKASCARELREIADLVERGDASVFYVACEPKGEGFTATWSACCTRKLHLGILSLCANKYVKKLEEFESDW